MGKKINVEDAKNRLLFSSKNSEQEVQFASLCDDEVGVNNDSQGFDIEFVKQFNDNLYVFKKIYNNGIITYLLSPADDCLDPIIGEFDDMPDDNSIPPSLEDWLNGYSEEINYIQNHEDIVGANENLIELIDLGLPSETKWANINIGGTDETELGDYYAWGELETKDKYTWDNYKYYDNVNSSSSTPKTMDIGTSISKTKYDVAYSNDKKLCIPTADQWQELIDNCTFVNKGNGYEITGPNGNKIFLPFSGYFLDKKSYVGTGGYYMTSTTQTSNDNQYAKIFECSASKRSIKYLRKRAGIIIRAVGSNEIIEEIPVNNIKFVDLGLSVNWAESNISVNNEELGDYYAWGELETKDKYTWDNYKYYDNVNSSSSTPKTMDIGTSISKTKYDVAYSINKNMCIPTADQWQELIDNCTFISKGNGYEITGPNGNKIFLPFSGYFLDKKSYVGTNGYYMTATTQTSNDNQYAKIFECSASKRSIKYLRKRAGITIRPVTVKANNTKETIKALMPYKWGQGDPWNNALPLDPSDGKRVITGCINTSMAQLIVYYGTIGVNGKIWKRSLPGVKSYTTNTGTKKQVMPALPPLDIDYDVLKFNKNTDFAKSKNQKGYEMIGKLMRQLGCINVSSYSSSITTSSIGTSLLTYKNILNFGDNIKRIYASNGLDTFIELIYKELKAGYPINMIGYNSKGTGGHAFICDGYNAETNKFHFNWGWNGNYDGWFSMSLMQAGSYDLTYAKQALINVHPKDKITLDINNDNSIDVTDIMVIIQDILDKKLYDYKKDLNNDGKIDENDIKVLVDYILGNKK